MAAFTRNAGKVRIATIAILGTAAFAIWATMTLTAPRAFSLVVQAGSAQPFPPPPRHVPLPPGVRSEPQPALPPAAAQLGLPLPALGSWTPLNNQPSFSANGVFLLTDGRVLVQDGNFMNNVAWWTLTPDNTGSYINGTWSQVASPGPCPNGYPGASADTVYSPLYYASAMLPDGRFVMIGGEYDYNYTYYNGSNEVWTNQGAIYDPVANTWTCIAAPNGWTQIGDAQSVVLPNGTFMVADPFDNEVATLNAATNPPTFNSPFTPPGKTADPFNDEEGWTLLPNGWVLTLEVWNTNDTTQTPSLVYSSSSQTWNSTGTAPDLLVNTTLGEIGPAILRPDGTVFAEGATGFNDIYNTNTGVWSSGPTFPTITDTSCSGAKEQLVATDAPAALLPDGDVLIAASPIDPSCPSPANPWVPPTVFFEFDGSNLTLVNAPPNAINDVSFIVRLLVLPTGQVLLTDGSNDVEIYAPAGTPNSSWAPSINSSPAQVTPGGTYSIGGTQFNGFSQAVGYGDDYQAATNYPLVRMTNNATGHVFYARTHDHSTMAVATGSKQVSTEFDVPAGIAGGPAVPAGIELGPSTLVVVANGIASQPVNVNVSAVVSTPTPTATPTPTPTATPTPTPTPVPALLNVKPTSVKFGKVSVGSARVKTLTLSNAAKTGPPITFGSPNIATVPATNPQEFGFPGGATNCPAQLFPKQKCQLFLELAPASPGPKFSTVTIFDNASNAPQTVPLSGTGK